MSRYHRAGIAIYALALYACQPLIEPVRGNVPVAPSPVGPASGSVARPISPRAPATPGRVDPRPADASSSMPPEASAGLPAASIPPVLMPPPSGASLPPGRDAAPAPVPVSGQDLQGRITQLEKENRELRSRMDELQTKLARLEYELNQINPKGGRAKEGRLIEDKLKEEKSIQKSPSGQLAFYHIWATSCGPCLGELARVVELAKKLRQQGVSVSFIAEEATSSMNTASTLFAKYGGTADLLKIQQGIAGDFRHRNKLPPATQPVSLLTGPGGRRLFVRVGALKSSDYELLTRCAAQRPEHVCQ